MNRNKQMHAPVYEALERLKRRRVVPFDVPTVPTSPSTKKNVALGGILALALIVGIYTVRFLMDDTVKTAEDVEKIIGVMPLTVILEYQDKDKKKKGRHRRK